MVIRRLLLPCALLLTGALLAACGDESPTPRLRGCTPEHDAAGTYHHAPEYLDERLRLLAEAMEVEERPFDAEALGTFVAGMKEAWANARLVLAPDGRFSLTGVVHPEFASDWQGTWEVRLEPTECKLLLRGGGEELHALLGDGWILPWIEEPRPGVILDVRLERAFDPRDP